MESNKQERTNLLGINYLTKHMSTPLSMGGNEMAPKATGPIQGNVFSKALLDNNGNYDAAKKEIESGGPQMNNGAPTLHLTKKNGKEKSARHLGLHQKHGTHDKFPSVGDRVGKVVNKVKDAAIKVKDAVVDNAKDLATTVKGGTPPTQKAAFYKHGGPFHGQGENAKDDESIAGRIGAKGANITNQDRRDESLGKRGTRT